MRPAAALALTISLAGPAGAQTILPTLYDVTGVRANDVLNIRAMPDASSSILSELPHDAKGVEVVDARAGWARVNTFERSGWGAVCTRTELTLLKGDCARCARRLVVTVPQGKAMQGETGL